MEEKEGEKKKSAPRSLPAGVSRASPAAALKGSKTRNTEYRVGKSSKDAIPAALGEVEEGAIEEEVEKEDSVNAAQSLALRRVNTVTEDSELM